MIKKIFIAISAIFVLYIGGVYGLQKYQNYQTDYKEAHDPNKALIHAMKQAREQRGNCGIDLTDVVQKFIPLGMPKQKALELLQKNGFGVGILVPQPEESGPKDLQEYFGFDIKDLKNMHFKAGELEVFGAGIHEHVFPYTIRGYSINMGFRNKKMIKVTGESDCVGL